MSHTMSDKAEEKVYSERQAAARLGVSRITVQRARQAGRLSYYRIGARVVYSETEHIRPFLDSCKRQTGGNGSNNGKTA